MIFTCLPFDKLDKLSLQKRLDEIGRVRSEEMSAGSEVMKPY
jgi:hypothetical protein